MTLTTRDDGAADTPGDWQQFEAVVDHLAAISEAFGLAARSAPR